MKPGRLVLLLAPLLLCGCTSLTRVFCLDGCSGERVHADGSSSLVEYLYPDGRLPAAQASLPELHPPLRVGLAFLPPRGGGSGLGLDAPAREELLQRIAERFSSRPFISQIVTVPDYYLSPGSASLPALQRLYQFDVLALVSYNQLGQESDKGRSWTYLTIVGAFLVNGTRQDLSTLVDLAVIDPATRALLLRAGGTDQRTRSTNWVDARRDSRLQATEGYRAATSQLLDNFDVALKQFENDVKRERAPVKVRWKGGGGALSAECSLALLALLALRRGRARLRSSPGRLGA